MLPTKNNYNIIIVGGGPAGSSAAFMLAQNGLSVLLVEAGKTVGRKVCGEFLCAEGVSLLKEMGLFHLIEKNQFLPSYGAKIVTQSGKVAKGSFPITAVNTVGGYCLNRQIFDNELLTAAKIKGTTIITGEWVTDIKPIGSSNNNIGWNIMLRNGESYTCDLLIGADGRRSVVARQLKLTRPDPQKRLALRCFLPTKQQNERVIEMHVLTGGDYIGIDVVGENEVNFSIVTSQKELKKYASSEALIRDYFKRYPALQENMLLPEAFPKIEAVSPVTHRVKNCIASNVVLIGDAGGFIEPLTGEGITIALWTARTIAACLKQALEDRAWVSRQTYLKRFKQKKQWHFIQKQYLYKLLYKTIASGFLCNMLYKLIATSEKRTNIFMGMINNTYTPLDGMRRILLAF